jgi:hypothetical protein
MDAVEFARSIRELALRAHGMPSDRTTREELIELRRWFLDALAAAPETRGGVDRPASPSMHQSVVQSRNWFDTQAFVEVSRDFAEDSLHPWTKR